MEKIQCMTVISRYECMVAENRHQVVEMIKKKMAHDIAREILNRISVIEETDNHTGDLKFRLSFWTTTSNKETAAVDEIMKIVALTKEIK